MERKILICFVFNFLFDKYKYINKIINFNFRRIDFLAFCGKFILFSEFIDIFDLRDIPVTKF
jgi:hypothetical protein